MKSNELNAILEELITNSDDTSREMSLCQEMAYTIRKEKEKENAKWEMNGLMNDLSCKNMKLGRLQTLNEHFKNQAGRT